jgi:folate-binding protein YgfZ
MNTPGYQALTTGSAVLDLSARGRIKVTGEDRARLLHAMTTNHVQNLKPGQGLYAFFLNAQGKIQADVIVLCFEDHLLLDVEPSVRALVYEHLDRFIIADDAELEDVTETTFCLGLEGPSANETVASLGFAVPETAYAHTTVGDVAAARITATGQPGVRLYGPAAGQGELLSKLGAAVPATEADAEIARIHNFLPRFGFDISDATLPQETQMTHALHFQKGCYLGQEIVERIRSRGHVNRQLMGFRLEGHAVPAPGTVINAGGKEAGEVTSAAEAPEGRVFGLAYIRVPYGKPGGIVGIDGRPAELFPPAALV